MDKEVLKKVKRVASGKEEDMNIIVGLISAVSKMEKSAKSEAAIGCLSLCHIHLYTGRDLKKHTSFQAWEKALNKRD